MSIQYPNVARAIALRANQLKSAKDAAEFETNYTGDLETNMEGLEVPYTALKDAIMASEKRIVGLIGRSSLPILRRPLQDVSANVASGALIPLVGVGGGEFFGTFSGVYESGTNTPLKEKPYQEVARRKRNSGTFYKLNQYYYAFDGVRIVHTCTNVFLEGVVWKLADALAQFAAFGYSNLPAELETLLIADVLANLPQENWFVAEGQTYLNLVQKGEQQLLQGIVPAISLPSNTAHADPIKE